MAHLARDLLPGEAVVVELPALIKARATSDGRRMIDCEVSNEQPDAEGDVIEQAALLDSADYFLKNGHIDIDHISEIGSRYGIRDPESYIIGRPTEVRDLGGKRTGIVGEIRRSASGVHNPVANRYDALWDAISSDPPVLYRASIYGFPSPDGFVDCRGGEACSSGATRFHIKSIRWKSLALTTRPINDSIRGHVRIVSAKALISELIKAGTLPSAGITVDPRLAESNSGEPQPMPIFQSATGVNGTQPPGDGIAGTLPPAPGISSMVAAASDPGAGLAAPSGSSPTPVAPPTLRLAAPRNLSDALGQYHHHIRRGCEHAAGMKSTLGFDRHFQNCCGMDSFTAEVFAHALMHALLLDSRRV